MFVVYDFAFNQKFSFLAKMGIVPPNLVISANLGFTRFSCHPKVLSF